LGISHFLSFLLLFFAECYLVVVMMSDLRRATDVFRVNPWRFLVLRWLSPVSYGHNAIPDSPNNHARNKCEQRGYDQGLDWVDPMKDDNLVNCIKHERDEKYLAGNSPQVSEHDARLSRVACKGPEEDRPTFTGIRPSRSNRKKCRNNGLDDQPEAHRSIYPTEEIIPRLPECLFHGTTTLCHWTASLSTSMKAWSRSMAMGVDSLEHIPGYARPLHGDAARPAKK
jgi:hypothetical protein